MTASNFVIGLIQLMRPMEWSKTFGNMILAYFLAAYVLQQPFNISLINPLEFLIAFIAVGPLLWGGLYALNDYTDRENDSHHSVKKLRPIPSKKVPAKIALIFSIALILLSLIIGYLINFLFFLILIVMIVNQALYTLKPFHFKSRKVLDLISGSIINPFFRFFAGWVLLIPAFNAPILMLLFVIGFQFSGYLLYRISTKKVDEKLEFGSSVASFDERNLKKLSYLIAILSTLAFLAMIIIPIIAPAYSFLGVLPLQFLILVILSLPLIPLYAKAITQPQLMDMKKTYKNLYIHYTLFIILYVFLFLFF